MNPALAQALPSTLTTLMPFVRERYGAERVLGRCAEQGVSWLSAAQVQEAVDAVSLGLGALGIDAGDRVAIASESRPEWTITDLAVLARGGVTVTVYPTLSAEQMGYILRDSGARVVFVSTTVLRDRVLAALGQAPAVIRIVVMEDGGSPPAAGTGCAVTGWREFVAQGRADAADPARVAELRTRAAAVTADDLATLIYTSGTTGEPKGVMLTHGNLVANLRDICFIFPVTEDDEALSFLPLSHSLERMVIFVYLAYGISIAFAESNDTVARDLLRARPTVMTAVPRVFEKLRARILEKGRAATGLRRWLFEWAVGVAVERGRRTPEGRPVTGGLRWQSWLAERLVFGKVRAALGGRFRFIVSGSAALNEEVARFFFGIGMPIMEGYGLTETAPVLTAMPLSAVRMGSVGVALPSVRLHIAEDGEILAQGPNIMRGYYNRPVDTAEAFTDGWFRTGDIGTLDADGYLHITDRKKELIVTSGGKKIAPQAIEARLKTSPLVGEAVVVGEGRNYPAVLLVPDWAAVAVALERPRPATPEQVGAAVADPAVREAFQDVVDRVNGDLAQFERLKRFALLPNEFSIGSGELTPTMKVRRRVIDQKYADDIARLYA